MFKWFLGIFGKKAARAKVPVLCKFWMEDGVWNGSAHDLPVAVFGKTIEEAKQNLCDAIISHFQALEKLGQVDEVICELQRLTRERLSFDEMAHGELFCTITTGVMGHGYEVFA